MSATASTMSLSWLPPEKPNGIILDYEIKYHEKVSRVYASNSILFNRLPWNLCSVNVENNVSPDKHMVAMRQVTVSSSHSLKRSSLLFASFCVPSSVLISLIPTVGWFVYSLNLSSSTSYTVEVKKVNLKLAFF